MVKNTDDVVFVSLEDAVERLFNEHFEKEIQAKYNKNIPAHKFIKKTFFAAFSTGLKFCEDRDKNRMTAGIMTIKDVNILIRNNKIAKPGSMFFEEFYDRVRFFPELNIEKPSGV